MRDRARLCEFDLPSARRNVGPETNLADLEDEGLFGRLLRECKPAGDGLLKAAKPLAWSIPSLARDRRDREDAA